MNLSIIICSCLEPMFYENKKRLNFDSINLKIRGKNFPSNDHQLLVQFSNDIQKGLDYEVIPRDTYTIPKQFQNRKRNDSAEVITFRLLPRRSWEGNVIAADKMNTLQIPLYITKAWIEFPSKDGNNISTSVKNILMSKVQVAIVTSQRHKSNKMKPKCPAITNLPGMGHNLMKFIQTNLQYFCSNIHILQVYQLKSSSSSSSISTISKSYSFFNSWSLLYRDPPLLIIDGSGEKNIESAAEIIDNFVAAHGVLEIIWEPIYPGEPAWWILMPRPKGMPGQLLGMLDTLQWRHPAVQKSEFWKMKQNRNCTKTSSDQQESCIEGCPTTMLKRFISSGYNADTEHISGILRKAIAFNTPYQVAPVRLGKRGVAPFWEGTVGWSYTFSGCPSNFLDCFFLAHSPCPAVQVDILDGPGHLSVSPSRYKERPLFISGSEEWYAQAVGLHTDKPLHATGDYFGPTVSHVLYSYIFRPNYRLRREIQRRVDAFSLEPDTCSIMHVRRGDSVMHSGQGRAYLSIESYVRAGRPLMDALGIHTVLLFTDSIKAIEEALRCEQEFPDVCKGIQWRYVQKKRWVGAEGGWENPFPSGNATEELLAIQLEFALAQKCSMAVLGNSGYGDLLKQHMCCGFPMHHRGTTPKKCICPPYVKLKQADYNCATGNKLLCTKKDIGGNIHLPLFTPSNMLGANFSFTKDAYRDNPETEYFIPDEPSLTIHLNNLKAATLTSTSSNIISQKKMKEHMAKTVKYVCQHRQPFYDGTFPFCIH